MPRRAVPKIDITVPTPYGAVSKQVSISIAAKYRYVAIVVDNSNRQIIDTAWTFKNQKAAIEQLRSYKPPEFTIECYEVPQPQPPSRSA
jgi:hypothetical protein